MPGITREEVIHFARLSHLELTSEELDHFTEQLAHVVQVVARVGEVTAERVPPAEQQQRVPSPQTHGEN
ncbi:Asp-tRNA(Asn)/Glu-tRNA(Gln) amidotransferase subunit GatC [Streptomyces cyaneofuscatus]|uniref:Asp-tRNA(Asn)/Glu-tRNA(Gln) amidotransferase subunit GatC n=1 Tax=Streptomyces TaxID=1883 RepID=UPI00344DA48F